MDTYKESSFLACIDQTLPPAQLWIGRHDQAIEKLESFLQRILCKNNGCSVCTSCMQIREKQHHALMWLYPEKNYTIDQLDDLFATLAFQLQPNELFFFIIQKADFLTPACANRLLKPMEEPPRGYHFILLAERVKQILPTVRSRCVINVLETASTPHISHPLFESFTTKIAASDEFSKIVDGAAINERESIELLDQIICYWLTTDPTLFTLITTLQQAQLRPPMPGSCTTFWRNLYLQLHDNLNITLK